MFQREVSVDDVLRVVRAGEVIAEYPDDEPFPSYLILGFSNNDPLHVVVGRDDASGSCHIITVYSPNPSLWGEDYRTRQ